VQQPCLWDSFLCFLSRNKHPVPEAQLQRDVTAPLSPSPELQAILIDIYKRHTAEAEICERLVDLDEGIQEWRYRHIKMVERTIGRKRGSGGSAGADYLKNTIFKPLYPDLWEIRVSF
jgi:tryptophan 2,3-dioxygenase